jgi:DNA-binding IclR family transcriptional regulator
MADSSSGYRDRNSTADRALAILDLYTEARSVLTATQVSEHLGVARSTAYRYLQSLVQARYLAETPGGYSLGLKVLELARVARKGLDVGRISHPVMVQIAREFRETVLLTRRVGDSIVCIEREEPDGQRLHVSYEPGTIMPINAGASAQVLLAWLSEDDIHSLLAARPLRAFTPNTLTDPGLLLERLQGIREQGYALSVSELDPEVIGIAAPIFDSFGTVRAAISMVGLTSRIDPNEYETIAARIVEAARGISVRLGLLD